MREMALMNGTAQSQTSELVFEATLSGLQAATGSKPVVSSHDSGRV
jgi:hypothetical protein